MTLPVTPILGTNFSTPETVQRHDLGTTVTGADGFVYVYVQAGGAIAASQTDISVTDAFQATDGSGTFVGPAVAVANDEFLWVHAAQELKNIT